jgi:hypothetical protein
LGVDGGGKERERKGADGDETRATLFKYLSDDVVDVGPPPASGRAVFSRGPASFFFCYFPSETVALCVYINYRHSPVADTHTPIDFPMIFKSSRLRKTFSFDQNKSKKKDGKKG